MKGDLKTQMETESTALDQMAQKAQSELESLKARRDVLTSAIEQQQAAIASIDEQLFSIEEARRDVGNVTNELEETCNKAQAFAELAAGTPNAESAIARLRAAQEACEQHAIATREQEKKVQQREQALHAQREQAQAAIASAQEERAAIIERITVCTTARNQVQQELGEALQEEARAQLVALEEKERRAARALVEARLNLSIARDVVRRQLTPWPELARAIQREHNLVEDATARAFRSHLAYLEMLSQEAQSLPDTINNVTMSSVLCMDASELQHLERRSKQVRDLLRRYEQAACVRE